MRHTFWNGSYGYPPEVLPAKGSVIIYGGTKDFTNSPALATACFVADTGTLALNDSGGETLTLRNQDSNVISRVYYAAGAPQGSLTRFPNLAGSFQPQAAVWTNYSSPGAQFNGATFAQASPSLTNVVPAALRDPSRNVAASWPGVAGRHYTVWQANEAAGPYTAFRSVPGAAPTTGATLTNDAPPPVLPRDHAVSAVFEHSPNTARPSFHRDGRVLFSTSMGSNHLCQTSAPPALVRRWSGGSPPRRPGLPDREPSPGRRLPRGL